MTVVKIGMDLDEVKQMSEISNEKSNESQIDLINRIKCAIRHIQTAVDVDPWAVEIAVDAMEKQIPKKPKKIDHWRLCPNCYEKNGFSYDYLVGMKQRYDEDISYCLGCGQAIDWEKE